MTLVGERAAADARQIGAARALAFQHRVGGEHAPAKTVGRAEIEAQPVVLVEILCDRLFLLVAVEREYLVVEREGVRREREPVVEAVARAHVEIVVLRIPERRINEVEQQVHVAAPGRDCPVGGAGLRGAVERRAHREERGDGFAMESLASEPRRDVDHPAATVSECDREAPGVHADVADDRRVDAAEHTEEILQVIGVVEPQVVETDQRFLLGPAAQVKTAGEVEARDARQPRDCAHRVFTDVRQRLQLRRTQDHRRNRVALPELVVARADDDRLDRRRRRRAGGARRRVPRRARRPAHEHQRAARPVGDGDAVRREDLGEPRARLDGARLALDAHPGLDQVTAVEDLDAARAQLLQDAFERQAAPCGGLGGRRERDQQEREHFHSPGGS